MRYAIASLLCLSGNVMAGSVSVTHGNVAASASTCTLAQAIYAANRANNPSNATPPGATTIAPRNTPRARSFATPRQFELEVVFNAW